jgi:tetratricopeptide (TPR) repeat protein
MRACAWIVVMALCATLHGAPVQEKDALAAEKTAGKRPAKTLTELVAELGSRRYNQREMAEEKLRLAGEAARPALEAALKSKKSSPDIRGRAKTILADLDLGITPKWQPEAVIIVRHYDALSAKARRESLPKLAKLNKDLAVPFLLNRIRKGKAAEQRSALDALQTQIINPKDNTPEAKKLVLRTVEAVEANIKEPPTPGEVEARAWARMAFGNMSGALDLYGKLEAESPLRTTIIETGITQMVSGIAALEYAKVVTLAQELQPIVPDEGRILYLQAEALTGLGKGGDADALCAKALTLKPEDGKAHLRTAQLLHKMGLRSKAEGEYRLAIAPKSLENVQPLTQLGLMYRRCGLWKKATAAFTQARELIPEGRQRTKYDNVLKEIAELAEEYEEPKVQTLPNRPTADSLDFEVVVKAKKGEEEELKKAVSSCSSVALLKVRDPKTRVLDKPEAILTYNPAKQELLVRVGQGSAKVPGVHLRAEKPILGVQCGDMFYAYSVDVATGEMKQVKRFEMDYIVTLKPRGLWLEVKEAELTLGQMDHAWGDLQKGVEVDTMRPMMRVTVEGTRKDGRYLKEQFMKRMPKMELPRERLKTPAAYLSGEHNHAA